MAAPRPALVVPTMLTVPALVIVLDESTVMVATFGVVRVDEIVLPCVTLTLTLVLPAWAATTPSVPVQVTVVPLAGVTLSQAARALPATHSDIANITGLSGRWQCEPASAPVAWNGFLMAVLLRVIVLIQ
ncbi:hypothetical protein AT302_21400 [Pandoraea norimbergensis]|uniref:Uncharacterized protein n=1 Tax=Pandoraea norimbergensis TaxID=93219 RepID=A0ABN4JMN3_9BURK|nr:hypothetical protein AT302_21400 [Pandoraea norimbergensis]